MGARTSGQLDGKGMGVKTFIKGHGAGVGLLAQRQQKPCVGHARQGVWLKPDAWQPAGQNKQHIKGLLPATYMA